MKGLLQTFTVIMGKNKKKTNGESGFAILCCELQGG